MLRNVESNALLVTALQSEKMIQKAKKYPYSLQTVNCKLQTFCHNDVLLRTASASDVDQSVGPRQRRRMVRQRFGKRHADGRPFVVGRIRSRRLSVDCRRSGGDGGGQSGDEERVDDETVVHGLVLFFFLLFFRYLLG